MSRCLVLTDDSRAAFMPRLIDLFIHLNDLVKCSLPDTFLGNCRHTKTDDGASILGVPMETDSKRGNVQIKVIPACGDAGLEVARSISNNR